MKDIYGKEVNIGDKVIYIKKSYGYRSLSYASLRCGIINKVTEKTVVISSVKLVNGELVMDDSYQNKLTNPSDCIMIVDEFPKQFIDSLINKEN